MQIVPGDQVSTDTAVEIDEALLEALEAGARPLLHPEVSPPSHPVLLVRPRFVFDRGGVSQWLDQLGHIGLARRARHSFDITGASFFRSATATFTLALERLER